MFDMRLTGTILVLSLVAGIFGLAIYKRTAAHVPTVQGPRQPVIVELFTSEGCSSCPPADQLLAKLETEQPVGNAEILALEEHVDYWNQGGWVDPFSSDSATIRQYAYGGALGNGNAYTPQMVVDGQSEFVGSREGKARSAIEQAGNRKKTEVTVTADGSGKNGTPTLHIKVGALQNADGRRCPGSLDGHHRNGIALERKGRRKCGRRAASRGSSAQTAKTWRREKFRRDFVFCRAAVETGFRLEARKYPRGGFYPGKKQQKDFGGGQRDFAGMNPLEVLAD